MGMSSPRSPLLLLDAIPARTLLPKRSGTYDLAIRKKACREVAPSKMAFVDDAVPLSAETRLPSQRPINQRWDRSRGLLHATTQRNVIHDFRWSPTEPILFANTPASSRSYAKKSILGSTGEAKPNTQSQRSDDLVDRPDRMSATYVDRKEVHRQEVENLKAASTEDLRKKDVEIQRWQNEHRKSMQHVEFLKNKLAEPDQKLKAREAALKKSETAFEQKKAMEEAEIKQRETSLDTREAGYHATMVGLQKEAVDAANQEVKDIREAAIKNSDKAQAVQKEAAWLKGEAAALRKAAADDSKKQKQQHQDVLRELQNKASTELRSQKDKLEIVMDQRLSEELRKVEQRSIGRESEGRQDYDNYRQVWDQLWHSIGGLVREVPSTTAKPPEQPSPVKSMIVKFDGAKVHPKFASKYPDLNRRLSGYFEGFQHLSSTMDNESMVGTLVDQRTDLALTSHAHRLLTRFHRFNEKQSSYDRKEMELYLLNEVPLRQYEDRMLRQLNRLRHQSRKAERREREGLQTSISKLKINLRQLREVSSFNSALREIDALKALQESEPFEQDVFLQTKAAEDVLDSARKLSLEWTETLSNDADELPTRKRRRPPEEFAAKYAEARGQIQEHHDFIVKRCLLEIHLGKENYSQEQLGAQVQRLLDKSYRLAYKRLNSIGQTAPLVVSSSTATKRPLSSPLPRAAHGTQMYASRTTTLNDKIMQLKTKLKDSATYRSEQAKQQAEEGLGELKQQLQVELAANLKIRRDALKISAADPSKLANVEYELQRVETAISSETTTHRGTRARRRAKQSQSASRTSGDAPSNPRPNSNVEIASGGGLNLSQTAARQARLPSWLDHFRYFHAEDAKARSGSETFDAAATVNDDSYMFGETSSLPQASISHSLPSSRARSSDSQVKSGAQDSPESSQLVLKDDADHTNSSSQPVIETDTEPGSAESTFEPSDSEGSVAAPSSIGLDEAAENMPNKVLAPITESDENLSYRISAEDYRKAILASKNTSAAFWSHKLYKNAEGKIPTAHYCMSYETSEAQAKQFVDESVLGFDLEWEFGATPEKSSIKNSVSLVQISSESKIGLFHLALFKGDKPEQLMPPSLRGLLESKDIAKVGVNVSGDALRIEKCFGVRMTGLFELSHLYKVVMHSESSPEKVNKRMLNLADQVQNILLLPLKKGDVRTSAWSKRLRSDQTDYAASDAYAGFRLYHALEAKRKGMDPSPPRPAFYEEDMPLILANGQKVVARKRAPRKKLAGTMAEDGDDECEEFFDAVETQDASQTGGVPLSGIANVTYPLLPSTNQPDESTTPLTNESFPSEARASLTKPAPSSSKPQPIKRSTSPTSDQVTLADTWAQNFRVTLPPEYNLKVRHPTLRAYHLWHEQRFDIREIAALLRHPPLSLQTVAGYVLQALNEENLPFEEHRAKVALNILPRHVHGRYWKLVGRMEEGEP